MKKTNFTLLCLTLYTCTVAGCSSLHPAVSSDLKNSAKIYNEKTSISGKVFFPDFKIKAEISEITKNATVSLMYPPDYKDSNLKNTTIATGFTNSDGSFLLKINIKPETNQIYVIDARRRLAHSAQDSISMRSFIKWNGANWESMYSDSNGVYIDTKTTAITLLSANGKFNSDSTIKAITLSGNINGLLTNHSAEIKTVNDLVKTTIIDSNDPIKGIVYDSVKDQFYNSDQQNVSGSIYAPSSIGIGESLPVKIEYQGKISKIHVFWAENIEEDRTDTEFNLIAKTFGTHELKVRIYGEDGNSFVTNSIMVNVGYSKPISGSLTVNKTSLKVGESLAVTVNILSGEFEKVHFFWANNQEFDSSSTSFNAIAQGTGNNILKARLYGKDGSQFVTQEINIDVGQSAPILSNPNDPSCLNCAASTTIGDNLIYKFNLLDTNNPAQKVKVHVDWGDGSQVSISQYLSELGGNIDVNHTYNTAGDYTLYYTSFNESGKASNTLSKTIKVNPKTYTYSTPSNMTSSGSNSGGGVTLKAKYGIAGGFLIIDELSKIDGKAFTSTGNIFLKVGSGESFGVDTQPSKPVPVGSTYARFELDLSSQNWLSGNTKDYYLRLESTTGDNFWAYVGPIRITRQ